MINDTDKVTLISLNKDVECYYEEPEWGFPKGRRNLKESDIDFYENFHQKKNQVIKRLLYR